MPISYFRRSTQMGWFNGWFGTRWYSMLYGHRDESDAASMVLPIIRGTGLRPGGQVLDLGCGRGRHAEAFARAGLSVTGIDVSEDCIVEARIKVPNARFEVFDIRDRYASEQFDVVVCLFTCLGYTGDRRDDQQVVTAAADALKPNGNFVLDLLNGPWVIANLVPEETLSVHDVSFHITRKIIGDEIVKWITVKEDAEVRFFEERVHAWNVQEVTEMIRAAGLELEALTDGSLSGPFDPERSDRIVAWTRKPA